MRGHFSIGILLLLAACGQDEARKGTPLSLTEASTQQSGYTAIMPESRMAQYRALIPTTDNDALNGMLLSPQTMWYDKESMIPGYQDSMGDPEGMRPNSISKGHIDVAVPGGHAKLFTSTTSARFNFPFGTGGIDNSDNVHVINFWVPPRVGGRVLPVAYWKMPFSRWRWVFPIGTVLGEMMMIRFPDNTYKVFEIRTRTRTETTWANDIFRPFPDAESLVRGIATHKSNWASIPKYAGIVAQLQNTSTLQAKSLTAPKFPSAWQRVDGYIDQLPNFDDPELVKTLLANTTFSSTINRPWKVDGNKVTHAPTTQYAASIVPRNYDAGLFPVNDEFCNRCHQDAGRAIRDFYDQLMAYGEMWGEDRTFSWHLFDASYFLQPNGDVKNFNNDNRRVRADFVNAGLVEQFSEAKHPATQYRQLAQSWQYRPF